MPTKSKSYSRVSIECLTWIEQKFDIRIQHAESKDEDDNEEGEHALAVPGHKFKADGFSLVQGRRVCFEFHGCAWHGCLRCFPTDRETVLKGKTRDERLADTVERVASIRVADYEIVEIWECEWEDAQCDASQLIERLRTELSVPAAQAPMTQTILDMGFRGERVAGVKRLRS